MKIGTFIVLKTLIFRYLNFYDTRKKIVKIVIKCIIIIEINHIKLKKKITILFIHFLQLLLPQTKINK